LSLSVPASVGTLPAFYNFKQSAHGVDYRDTATYPVFSFGFGLSYTNFSRSSFRASTSSTSDENIFSTNDTITFHVNVKNTGARTGSDVPQIYLLTRTSSVVQPTRQMVAFSRVDLQPGEERQVEMTLDVNRFLQTWTRKRSWEVEQGEYVFALTGSAHDADNSVNVTMRAV
jgi:hypothetical protein